MYGYNAGPPMAIPIYTVLLYCVIPHDAMPQYACYHSKNVFLEVMLTQYCPPFLIDVSHKYSPLLSPVLFWLEVMYKYKYHYLRKIQLDKDYITTSNTMLMKTVFPSIWYLCENRRNELRTATTSNSVQK